MIAEPVLVGETTPYSQNPFYALYNRPSNSAGGRLQRLVLGLPPWNYLEIKRRNLCTGRWGMARARNAAATLQQLFPFPGHKLVLLGANVCAAFNLVFTPFSTAEREDWEYYVILPHPSGLNRLWNEPGAFTRAQIFMKQEFPHIFFGTHVEPERRRRSTAEAGDRFAAKVAARTAWESRHK